MPRYMHFRAPHIQKPYILGGQLLSFVMGLVQTITVRLRYQVMDYFPPKPTATF